jgi:prepilin-type N-terminal cleavage/methylation domain-containing protein
MKSAAHSPNQSVLARSADSQSAVSPICNRQAVRTCYARPFHLDAQQVENLRYSRLKICATRAAGGFSLIEVLCAILILGVAMAGLTRGITTALTSTKESELQTTAALIAAGLVESLRTEGGLLDGETEGSLGGGLALYRWKEIVTASRIDGLHEVKVVIENAKSGQTIYELETLLFEPTADTKPAKEKDKKAKKRGGSRG